MLEFGRKETFLGSGVRAQPYNFQPVLASVSREKTFNPYSASQCGERCESFALCDFSKNGRETCCA